MLTSLAKNPSHTFDKRRFGDDFEVLPPVQQTKVAANLAERARNAEIQRDGMLDMGISIGTDVIAVISAAIITGRTQARRDRLIAEWVGGGAAEASKDLADYPEPWSGPDSEERNPVGLASGLLRWSFAVPAVFFVASIFDWQGRRYAREGGFASLFYIVGDMIREVSYNRKADALEKEAQEAAA